MNIFAMVLVMVVSFATPVAGDAPARSDVVSAPIVQVEGSAGILG